MKRPASGWIVAMPPTRLCILFLTACAVCLAAEAVTTFSGCECLDPWYASEGQQLPGTCATGTTETQDIPWCFVNTTTCTQSKPFSAQSNRYQLNGLSSLDWDFCLPSNASSTTQAGCSCLLAWGYGGQSVNDGSCLSTDANDTQASWCLVAPGTCTDSPAGPNTTFHNGWDWCTPPSSNSSAPPATTSNSTGGDAAAQPDETLAGCQCAQEWVQGNVLIQGGACAAPDGDPLGNWCRVDIRTCPRAPERVHQSSGAWDYCAPLSPLVQLPSGPGNTTNGGCSCKVKWSLFPAGGFADNPWQNGCANPDGDPQGDWCVVDPSSCTDAPQGYLPAAKQAYDYCSAPGTPPGTQAASPSAPVPANSTAALPTRPAPAGTQPAPDNAQTSSTVTVAGCSCLSEWNFTADNGTVFNFTGGACGVPDSDPAGKWCYVDAKTCRWQPAGQGVRSLRYWDYCEPASSAPTQSGCQCRKRWTFSSPLQGPQTFYGQYGNPDDDPLGDWCVVQPQTCTMGLPFDELEPALTVALPLPRLRPNPQYYDYPPGNAVNTTTDTTGDAEGSNDDEEQQQHPAPTGVGPLDTSSSPGPVPSGPAAIPSQPAPAQAPATPAPGTSLPRPPATAPPITPPVPGSASMGPSPVTPAPPPQGRGNTAAGPEDDLPYR